MKETIASGLSREGLRRIAACTMLVDHIGATLFPGVLWLRCVGRLAFPIFAFFLGEGFRFTHSRRQYLLRLVLFALLSELPFNQMVYGRWIAPSGQNVLWTLALGLCAIACVQRAPSEPGLNSLFWYSAAAGCCLLGQLLRTDYGAFGVLLCLLFYCTRGLPGRFWICGGIFLLMCYAFQFVFLPGIPIPLEALALPAFPLLATYHGRRSHRQLPIRYAFYWFYPLHMLLLGLLAHTTP
mgnify:FL=1|jgi:hypothetical protein